MFDTFNNLTLSLIELFQFALAIGFLIWLTSWPRRRSFRELWQQRELQQQRLQMLSDEMSGLEAQRKEIVHESHEQHEN